MRPRAKITRNSIVNCQQQCAGWGGEGRGSTNWVLNFSQTNGPSWLTRFKAKQMQISKTSPMHWQPACKTSIVAVVVVAVSCRAAPAGRTRVCVCVCA